MPASDLYPSGIDPVHVWTIATTAAPGIKQDGTVLLVGGRHPARICLPNRPAAHSAEAALQLVGYQVARTSRGVRGRDLIVTGWSTEGLEHRLTVMRGVLQQLAAGPGTTAVLALELGRLPAALQPSQADQQWLVERAGRQLRGWISRTSGIDAPCDPRAQPSDPGCALRLAATRRAEEAIDDLATRHMRVAEIAVALYPGLRLRMDHASARDSAIRRAGIAFHLSGRLSPDTTQSPAATSRSPDPATPRDTPPAASPPKARPGTGSRPGLRTAQEFPAVGMPVSPTSRPPSTRGATRPRGRNFPSGRPGPHR